MGLYKTSGWLWHFGRVKRRGEKTEWNECMWGREGESSLFVFLFCFCFLIFFWVFRREFLTWSKKSKFKIQCSLINSYLQIYWCTHWPFWNVNQYSITTVDHSPSKHLLPLLKNKKVQFNLICLIISLADPRGLESQTNG